MILSPSGNQFTLTKGWYQCDIQAPAYNAGSHRARLDVVGGTVVRKGGGVPEDFFTGSAALSTGSAQMSSFISPMFEVESSNATFEVQHLCDEPTGTAQYDLGHPSKSDSGGGSYSEVIYTKVDCRRVF
jgi:hypothetical protein